MITEAQIEAAARSDASFDGRDFNALGRADRERYLSRACAAIEAAEAVAWRPISECAESGGYLLAGKGAQAFGRVAVFKDGNVASSGGYTNWLWTHFRPLPSPPKDATHG